MSDDSVAQFMAITSSELETAHQYLNAADNNLQQAIELFFASGGEAPAPQSTDFGDSDVRARIEGFDDQLVDDEAQVYNEAVRNMRRAEARSRKPRGVFSQNRDELEQTPMSKHERRLHELFRPPFDIINDITLEEAKENAQRQGKLVMINVQDTGEFSCQRLNRDIWRSKQVKQVVLSNFVFLQYDIEDPDGEEYRVLYPFEEYPHIAILDPWTGERQKVWSRVPVHDEFIEDVYDFVAVHGIPDEGITSEVVDLSGETVKTSMVTQHDTPVAPSTDSKPAPDDSTKRVTREEDDKVSAIEPTDAAEPAPGPQTTRIQLRYGDGKRTVRRFNLEDKVSLIYAVAKAHLGVSGQLTLTADRKDLESELAKTIEEANLKNSTVLVEAD